MNPLFDKLIIFIFCSILYILMPTSHILVIPILIIIVFACLLEISHTKGQKVGLLIGYMLFALWIPSLLYFLPLMVYYHLCYLSYPLLLIYLIPVGIHFPNFKISTIVIISILTFASWLIKTRTASFFTLKTEYITQRDQNKEYELYLKKKNEELLEKQDYEIYVATLNERNRIAREIHDVVGHVISSSILQLGALLVNETDPTKKENITVIKNTLDSGMDRIRESIHNLHEDSIDLAIRFQDIVQEFSFCEIELNYDAGPIHQNNLKYSMIAILQEALTNITKHSKATKVLVSFREHPAIYQLMIQDNGIGMQSSVSEGLGVRNMQHRVEVLHGNMNISSEDGLKIFITIPKEGIRCTLL